MEEEARQARKELPGWHVISAGAWILPAIRVPNQLGTITDMQSIAMKSVLIIDDNEGIRSVVTATLTFAGYAVREAENGREGILQVLAQRPDLILCDLKMPEMDGYRTLAAVRKFPGTAAIPFVLITGSLDRDEFRQIMTSGADDYLLKPFSANELIEAIESRLTRHEHVKREAYQHAQKVIEEGVTQFSAEFAMPFRATLEIAS